MKTTQARSDLGRLVANWACALGLLALLSDAAGAGETVEFNRDIRPILSENCFLCHGPDKGTRKADLRLDLRAVALDKGAIVPGKPDDSELVFRVLSDDPTELMPPPKSAKKLTAAQKDLLRTWVEQGAEYQPHWAYVTPERPEVPAVRARERVRNPIDAFVLAILEAKGIAPSREADRATLLRRLSLDLIGLPPTPEEVRAFVDDTTSDAYERQVDRLLDSPRYGERMAVPWLDLVRYADTVGYHGDQNQNIFPYRDYVIDAFNRNMPFDRFTAEQLAGDLLPEPTTEQVVASGFNRLNMMTREGGAQPKEYLAKYAADRVRTVATTWLGSTMGCAECHDHKFDPFTAKDFYRLAAFFADVTQWGVYNDYTYTPNPDLRGFSNDHPFPPEIEVESPNLQRRLARLRERSDGVLAASSKALTADLTRSEAFGAWRSAMLEFLATDPGGWATPPASAGAGVIVSEDGRLLIAGEAKKGDTLKVGLAPAPGWLASIRLEVLPDARHRGKVTRDGADTATIELSASVRSARTAQETPLAIDFADADRKEPRYDSGAEIFGVTSGWKTSARHPRDRQASTWVLKRPVRLDEGDRVIVTLKSANVGCVRVALSPFGDLDEGDLKALRAAPGAGTSEQSARSHALYLLGTGWDTEALTEYQAIAQEIRECRGGRAKTMVTVARPPIPTRLLPRGNFLDESGPLVEPGVPGFLPQPPDPQGRRLTRLDLARWLTSPANPLTARVVMNRLWKQFFGTGLSAVMEDVGAQGDWPTHPALLDWLAVEFREGGWDVKRMVRLLVLSSTYRQDSRGRPDLREADPTNRWLAAQSPRRLDAEFVRDNALAIAGLINLDMGGPSAFPYQPAGYYEYLQFPDRDYVADRDERQYRRGLYTHWQRTFLHPMLANFDAPSREECISSRTAANSPQQALTLLNDPTFVEAARVLARTLLAEPGTDAERIDRLYRKALARSPRAKEAESLAAFLTAQRTECKEEDPEATAWTSVCRVILNLHETITRY